MRFLLILVVVLSGCVTDAATRLAYDLEKGAGRLGKEEGGALQRSAHIAVEIGRVRGAL